MWFIATSRSIVLRGSVSMMSGTSMYLNGGLEPSETHPPAQQSSGPVSYTHLTLPTSDLV